MGPYAYFISLSILIAIILVVAEITYSMIELPGIHLGKHLVELGMHAK